MSYKIYADLALLWAFFINSIVLYITDRLLGLTTKLIRLFSYAFCTGFICTALYLFLFNTNMLLQNTLYVITYVIILRQYYKSLHRYTSFFTVLSTYLIASFFIVMLIMLLRYAIEKGIVQIIIFIIFTILFVLSIIIYLSVYENKKQLESKIFDLSISINNEIFYTKGYFDTGNILRDINGFPVIICTPNIATKFLGTKSISIINDYISKKSFNYRKAQQMLGIYFKPIPYKTISTGFSTMPGFETAKLTFINSKKTYKNVTIAISSLCMNLGPNVDILLNDSLKPF